MIHTATLVHDDILDESMVRRHAATVNAEWGNETAVLMGDYLFTHAFHLAASLETTLACRWIGHATNLVCEGEMQQVHNRGNFDLDEEDYFAIIRGKTAELTAVSCRLGAHYAGAPESTVRAMDDYGRDLGVAFQIADDVLDLWGEERAIGKSLGTDLEKQKLTLPLIRLLATSGPETAERDPPPPGRGRARGSSDHPRPPRPVRRPPVRLGAGRTLSPPGPPSALDLLPESPEQVDPPGADPSRRPAESQLNLEGCRIPPSLRSGAAVDRIAIDPGGARSPQVRDGSRRRRSAGSPRAGDRAARNRPSRR